MRWKQGIYQHGPQPVLVITTAHLRQKALSFFVTTNGKPTSAWNIAIQRIKESCGFRIGNGIVRFGYYCLADHLSFPLQVWPLGEDRYEVVVYWADGQGQLFVKTYHKPHGRRLNNAELAEMGAVIKRASDRLSAAIKAANKELCGESASPQE